jgi:mono/diheme cytochrome c family protein
MRLGHFHAGCAAAVVAVTLALTACTSATPTSVPRVEPTVTSPPLPALRADLVAEGQQIYAQRCAGCHGANLQGQPNWKKPLPSGKYPAPPHDDSGHTWHHPDALLKQIIVEGGNGTDGAIPSDMPAFGSVLNEREVDAALEFIKSRWSAQSREYQWRITVQEHGQ